MARRASKTGDEIQSKPRSASTLVQRIRGRPARRDGTVAVEVAAAGITGIDQIPLSELERRFVREFIANGGCASEALRAAGSVAKEHSLRAMASEMRWRPNVRKAIYLHQKNVAEATHFGALEKRQFLIDTMHRLVDAEVIDEHVEISLEPDGSKTRDRTRYRNVVDWQGAMAAFDRLQAMDQGAGVDAGLGAITKNGKLTHEAVMHMLGLMPPGRGSSSAN